MLADAAAHAGARDGGEVDAVLGRELAHKRGHVRPVGRLSELRRGGCLAVTAVVVGSRGIRSCGRLIGRRCLLGGAGAAAGGGAAAAGAGAS